MFIEDDLFDERAICEAIFKHSTEAILITDGLGKILHVNPAVLQLFGYGLYELITQPVHMLLPIRNRQNHENQVNNFSKNPHQRSMGEGKVLYGRKKNGSEFPLSASLSPATVGNTKVVVALIIDLSELEESKEQLNILNRQLEEKVALRTKELAQSINQLEKINIELQKSQLETQKALQKEKELGELKSRFVSMASHEFKTPLSTILSSLSLLEKYDKINEFDPNKKVKHFDRIRSNVKHLNNVLNDFLSLDRLQTGALEPQKSVLNLKEFLEGIVQEFENQLKDGQKINLKFDGKLEITSDENMLRNIMNNLVSNASKYSDENQSIDLMVDNTSSRTLISIKDYGIGIPDEDQKHLFERFFRAHNAVNIKGTGLGLTIVKRYVELLGGKISFNSLHKKGTEFIIEI
jgi:PAS domain S-box-containing protein